MTSGLKSRNLQWIRTWFSTKAFVLVAMSILLCAGIAGCEGGPGTAPGAFVLSSPMDGATNLTFTPTLIWTDADGETSYTVEIDDENTFSSPLVSQITGIVAGETSYVVLDGVLAGGTTYYWRVIAVNSAGSTTASNAPFSFTTLNSGALVPGFGAGGIVTGNPSTGSDGALGIAIDSTAMYVIGVDESPGSGNCQWRIEKRSLTDGNLVAGFGAGGVVISNPGMGAGTWVWDIAIDSTAMYVIGADDSPGTGDSQWRIEKRSLTDGSLVPGFGSAGVVTSNPSARHDTAVGIAIDSTVMYVVGLDHGPGPGNYQWRIEERSLTDGSLVTGFGSNGVVTSNPSTGSDYAIDIAIDATTMYVAGLDDSLGLPYELQWRIEKRSLTDGNLIAGFGAGGVVTSNATADYEVVQLNIAIDSTAMYVVGGPKSSEPGDLEWRIEKRNLTDGSLALGFGTDGVVTSNPSIGLGAGFDGARGIAIDSTAVYVAGFDESPGPGDLQWRIEKRSLTDGNLVVGFGAGGTATSNPTAGMDGAWSIAIDSAAIYVVGFDNDSGDAQWRIEKRVK